MAINVIVVAVTVLMGGFVVVWLACPRCRPWIEAPKWQPLAWDRPPRGEPTGHRTAAQERRRGGHGDPEANPDTGPHGSRP